MMPTQFRHSHRGRTTKAIMSLVLVLLLASLETAFASSDPHLDSVKEIFAWVNESEGGFVSHKQSVSRMVENDVTTPLMVVATEDIAEGELLVQTPWSRILGGEAANQNYGWWCGTALALAKEMKKRKPNPYAKYLLEEPDGQLPSQYSPYAKSLLWKVVGQHPDEILRSHEFDRNEASNVRLMPEEITDQLEKYWYGACRAPRDDVIAAKAASMVIQRADDSILIPAYDAYNHRNNDQHNGKDYINGLTKAHDEKGHQTFALREIKKGEQIVISYNMCHNCGGRRDYGFGTAEMFRDYGFVEWYPQRWYYPGFGDYNPEHDTEVNQFDLYQNEDTKDLTVVWTHLTKNDDKMERFLLFLQGELRRLQRLKHLEFKDMDSWTDQQWKDSGISNYEWTNINQFLDANIVAMTLALADLTRDTSQRTEPFTATPTELEELLADTSHYAPLEASELDDLAYYKPTCDNGEFYEFLGYIDTEEPFVTERHQVLGFSESYFFNKVPDQVDVCMDVDNTIAMCSAYRPYHYEYMTHVAARYVPNVQRVATIGNGDSMLLHEVLKYSSVELVVGLERDQTVPRQSFKHFKTDPHFHDPRVDWWFGDVQESLQVLPASYWGSFDVVLVDIAEHVLFEEVTPGITVLEALGKLLKPETGVLVKNEVLALKHSDKNKEFDYFMELVYDSPAVCEETLALASHGVDFFHAPIYDHGIAAMGNLVYTASPKGVADRHEMMHDYRANAPENCTGDDSKTQDAEPKEQTVAHGVLELVTLEHLASPLESLQTIADSMKTCIEAVGGFTIVENGVHSETEQHMTLIVLEEGYVAARVQENTNAAQGDANTFYVGFDIHLWSQTHRLVELKDALLQAHESQDASSHKIVVGGMFGTQHWKEDYKHIGPSAASSLEQTCDAHAAPTASTTTSSSTFDAESVFGIAIREALTLTKKDKAVVAVFCGSETDSCTSLEALQGHTHIRKLIPIYDCSGEDGKDTQQLIDCERSIIDQLRSELTYGKKLNMFVLDDGASKGLHQIAHSLFDTHMNRELFLSPHNIAITWSSSETASAEEPWRWEFLDRYRKQIHHDPVKLAKFVVSSTADPNQTYPLGIVSTKDTAMNRKLDVLETKLNGLLKEKAATVQLRSIHGGLYKYNTKNDAPTYSQKDYDKSLAEKRFQAQVPLARQTILQYEGTDAMKESMAGGSGPDCNFMEKLVYNAASSQGLGKSGGDDDQEILFRYPVGDGCVVLLIGDSFNAISVWDGKFHLDVNLFGLSVSETPSADAFDIQIRQFSPFVNIASDVQPRGIGRVVNFPEDLVSLDRASLAAGIRQAVTREDDDDEYDGSEDDDDA